MASNEWTHLVCIMEGTDLYVEHMQWECQRNDRNSMDVPTCIHKVYPFLCIGSNQSCISRANPWSCSPLACRGHRFSPNLTALCLCSSSLLNHCQVQEARLALAMYLPLCRALPSPVPGDASAGPQSPSVRPKLTQKSCLARAAKAPAACECPKG